MLIRWNGILREKLVFTFSHPAPVAKRVLLGNSALIGPGAAASPAH
jgi:hypothetical protein